MGIRMNTANPLCRERLGAVGWDVQKAVNAFFDVVSNDKPSPTPAPAPAPHIDPEQREKVQQLRSFVSGTDAACR